MTVNCAARWCRTWRGSTAWSSSRRTCGPRCVGGWPPPARAAQRICRGPLPCVARLPACRPRAPARPPCGRLARLLQGKSEGDIDRAAALFSEIQQQIDAKQLKPFIRTQYMRSAFQARPRRLLLASAGRASRPGWRAAVQTGAALRVSSWRRDRGLASACVNPTLACPADGPRPHRVPHSGHPTCNRHTSAPCLSSVPPVQMGHDRTVGFTLGTNPCGSHAGASSPPSAPSPHCRRWATTAPSASRWTPTCA